MYSSCWISCHEKGTQEDGTPEDGSALPESPGIRETARVAGDVDFPAEEAALDPHRGSTTDSARTIAAAGQEIKKASGGLAERSNCRARG